MQIRRPSRPSHHPPSPRKKKKKKIKTKNEKLSTKISSVLNVDK